jgi:FAD/FMN-containing dehydrogenase/Fe-S oxidoreductase
MSNPAAARSHLARRLGREIAGDVLFTDFDCARYATDGSAYQTFPMGVVLPKNQDDVAAAVAIAFEEGVPVTARGGGTGQSGQAVSEGLILDFSKYLTRLLYYDANARTCIVEPGMTLAALNRALLPNRVWLPVDIASAHQATIGGMTATDAIGWRSLRHGRMRDNIVAMDAVLANGAEASFGEIPEDFGRAKLGNAADLVLDTLEIVDGYEEAIRAAPPILGAQHGYNFAALVHMHDGETRPQNLAAFLAGSEGTLAIAKRIELKLTRRRQNRALGVCHFPTLAAALTAIPAIMKLDPTAIELTDRKILDLGIAGLPSAHPLRRILRQDSEALLFVEFMEGNRVSNAFKLKELADAMFALKHMRAVSEVIGIAMQKAAWAVRTAGLQRLSAQLWTERGAWTSIEELAVPVKSLPKAAEGLGAIFARRGIPLVWHGHAGAGALHLRPWRSDTAADPASRDVAEEAIAFLRSLGGAIAGEGGYGIARSDALHRAVGGHIGALHEQIKARFDPQHRLNPGKLVLPAQADDAALLRPALPEPPALLPPQTLACDNNGLCRSFGEGTMCPSFRVTRNERDSPRGRANSIRLALAGSLGADAFTSDAMAETLKLCVSCKACRVECPNAVDIAGAKIAFEAARLQTRPLSRTDRTTAFLPNYGPRLRRWRHFLNLRDFVPWMAPLSERLTGVSADRPWPRWRRVPFLSAEPIGAEGGREILLFPDTFNSYFDVSALHAAADVLAASGFRVTPLLPPGDERPFCCGRTLLEAGLVEEARAEARRLIAAAAPFLERGVQLVGLEPACILTMRDEFATILYSDGADRLAASAKLFEEVMSDEKAVKTLTPKLHPIEAEALMFSHCHQRAFGMAEQAKKVAGIVPGLTVREGDITCCGMGVGFGYRPETVGVSLQMGEQGLFPQIRRTGRDTLLLADGFACRKQIQDGTGRSARHTAVLLKLALLAGEQAGAGETGKAAAKRLTRWRRRYFR